MLIACFLIPCVTSQRFGASHTHTHTHTFQHLLNTGFVAADMQTSSVEQASLLQHTVHLLWAKQEFPVTIYLWAAIVATFSSKLMLLVELPIILFFFA